MFPSTPADFELLNQAQEFLIRQAFSRVHRQLGGFSVPCRFELHSDYGSELIKELERCGLRVVVYDWGRFSDESTVFARDWTGLVVIIVYRSFPGCYKLYDSQEASSTNHTCLDDCPICKPVMESREKAWEWCTFET